MLDTFTRVPSIVGVNTLIQLVIINLTVWVLFIIAPEFGEVLVDTFKRLLVIKAQANILIPWLLVLPVQKLRDMQFKEK